MSRSAPLKISFVGMTHLGLCSAAAAADKGFFTLGFDPDPALCASLADHQLPVLEPGLAEMLAANRPRMEFTSDPKRLADCDLVYVAPDVPTDDQGQSDLSAVDTLLEITLDHARRDAVAVVLSQVPPGYTRRWLRPGRALYYQVETLIFGRAIERATQPERLIVGCAEPERPFPPALSCYLEAFQCPVIAMRLESAELCKLSINVCLAASISAANTLAEISERIGADWGEIAPALRLDRRIGPHSYLAPGLGIGGGNLSRDLSTVFRLSQEHGTEAGLIQAFLANSAYRRDWALRILHCKLLAESPRAQLGVLGLAYKENTATLKDSPALALIKNLKPWPIRAFDPAVTAPVGIHPSLKCVGSALDAALGVDALLIMTPWPEFRSLSCAELARHMRGRLVIDPYRMLEPQAACAAGLERLVLGAV